MLLQCLHRLPSKTPAISIYLIVTNELYDAELNKKGPLVPHSEIVIELIMNFNFIILYLGR